MNVKIQIAGIRTVEDALECVKNGVDAIALLVGQSHTSNDFISKELARYIVKMVPPYQVTTLITHIEKAKEVIDLVKYVGVSCLQLHSYIKESEVAKIREALPNIKIVRLVHIFEEGSTSTFSNIKIADAIFTDSMNKKTNQFGGTGMTHDYNKDKMLTEVFDIPLIVAGGLNVDNVVDVINKVKPYGVDTNSGCKGKDGRMDYKRLKEFCDRVRSI